MGKTRSGWIAKGEAEFLKKCNRYGKVSTLYVRTGKIADPVIVRKEESRIIMEKLNNARDGYNILLDERGEMLDSPSFAAKIETLATHGRLPVRIITGGPFGVDQSVRDAVDQVIAFSPMVFPHELVRLMILEQLYRAFTILRGDSYHHV